MESKLIRHKYFLYATEFFAGMSVMAVELGASRLMAPYFSSSQIVWTVIIGVIMIAMALACEPDILIADEPTTALDVTIQAQILELMQDLQKKLGMAIIIVTHDLGVIADMCDEIIVMYGGRVCERGTAEDIFYRPHHEYTKGLLRSIPNVDKIGEKLIPIPGTPINLLNMPKGCAFCPRCENAMKICIEEVPQEMQMPDGHYASCWLNVKEAMEAKQGGGKHE